MVNGIAVVFGGPQLHRGSRRKRPSVPDTHNPSTICALACHEERFRAGRARIDHVVQNFEQGQLQGLAGRAHPFLT